MNDGKSPDEFARAMLERRADPGKLAKSRPDDFASRPLGIIMLLMAIFNFWLYTYEPIALVQVNTLPRNLSGLFTFLQPPFFVFGLIYTIFGQRASLVLGPTTKPNKWGWLLAIACIALSFAYMHFLGRYLTLPGDQV